MASGCRADSLPTGRVFAPSWLGQGAAPPGEALALTVAGRWGKAVYMQISLESMCVSTGHLDAPTDAHVPCQEIWW